MSLALAEGAPHPSTYRPEIDGLRAVAVLSVVFFHAGLPGLTGGFLGVDVFFVISGFLITGIMVSEHQRGVFSLAGFYARRARRILPALTVMLVVCTVPAWQLMTASQLIDFFKMTSAVALFFANFLLARSTGYFDGPTEERPLLHTWSLSVEEQFYFVLPLVLLLCWRWGNRRLVIGLSVLALASLAVSEIGWRHANAPNFFFTPSRAWELLVGSLASFVVIHPRSAWSRSQTTLHQSLAGLGLLGMAVSLVTFNAAVPMPSAYALLPVISTALVLVFARQGTWAAQWLTQRWLVALGLVSYSAYLWHQPLFAFARIASLDPLTGPIKLALIVATFVLAFMSWRWVEQPFRHPTKAAYNATLTTALACTAGLAAWGWVGGLVAHQVTAAVPESVLKAFAPPPRAKSCFDIAYAHKLADGWNCPINPGAESAASFVLFGDSHALQLLDAVESAARQSQRTGFFAGFSGCAPLLGVFALTRPDQTTHDCQALNQQVYSAVKAQNIKQIFLVAKWSYYTDYFNGTDYLNAIGLSKSEAVSLANSRRAFAQGVANTVGAYQLLGVKVHFIEQVPQQRYQPAALYQRAWVTPRDAQAYLAKQSVSLQAHRQLQAYPSGVFAPYRASAGVTVNNFDDIFCTDTRCAIGTPTTSYYEDLSHLSADGALRLVPQFTQLLGAGGAVSGPLR